VLSGADRGVIGSGPAAVIQGGEGFVEDVHCGPLGMGIGPAEPGITRRRLGSLLMLAGALLPLLGLGFAALLVSFAHRVLPSLDRRKGLL
jgi:hypothetical protein